MPPVIKKKANPVKKAKSQPETAVISGQLQKKVKKQSSRQKLQRGVVVIKHLPHGFFEDQLQKYFEQFGNVTRLRLARSKLTGGTKGYAYVEFEYPEVAEVAAETMDNYLMFNKVVKAAYIPPERQFFNYFKSSVRQVKNKAGKPIYVSGKTAAINRKVKTFNDSSEETFQKRTARKLQKIQKLNKKYAHLGIDFNSIVAGPKKMTEISENSDKAEPIGKNEVSTKLGKRKNKLVEKSSKKSKKALEVKDLLEDTLNEDTDDENYVPETQVEETDKGKSKNSVDLEDLLGATLNDDSDDDDWAANGGVDSAESDDEVDAQITDSEEEDEEEDDDDDDDEDEDVEENIPPQKKQKKLVKGKAAKKDHLDKLVERKKHVGGIQKANKAQSKKPKIGKTKNKMHSALTKEMAQPLVLVKNKIKTSKKK